MSVCVCRKCRDVMCWIHARARARTHTHTHTHTNAHTYDSVPGEVRKPFISNADAVH